MLPQRLFGASKGGADRRLVLPQQRGYLGIRHFVHLVHVEHQTTGGGKFLHRHENLFHIVVVGVERVIEVFDQELFVLEFELFDVDIYKLAMAMNVEARSFE